MKNKHIFLTVLIIVILLIVIISLVLLQRSNISASNNSGVEGQITYGPITPVCRIDESCYGTYFGNIIIRDDNNRIIIQSSTDNKGVFKISLPKGTYSLETEKRFISSCKTSFIVNSNKFTNVTLNCDTGIR